MNRESTLPFTVKPTVRDARRAKRGSTTEPRTGTGKWIGLPRPLCNWMRWTAAIAITVLLVGQAIADEKDEEKLEIAPPRDMTLETKDGVQLRCTFYPGGVKMVAKDEFEKVDGKDVVPVIMLHGWKGGRGEYDGMAKYLQMFGHAVVVPDIRGHGSSTEQKILGRIEPRKIDLDRMTKVDVAAMGNDIEAAKRFLIDENDAERVNIELLTVVASTETAIVAAVWAANDWSWPMLVNRKQGQDVKALVLLSPDRQFKGITADIAYRHAALRSQLSFLIVSGRKSSTHADSKRIYDGLQKSRPEPPSDPAEREEKLDLFFLEPDTELQGTKLLYEAGLNVGPIMARFIDLRLVRKVDQFPWKARLKKPDEAK